MQVQLSSWPAVSAGTDVCCQCLQDVWLALCLAHMPLQRGDIRCRGGLPNVSPLKSRALLLGMSSVCAAGDRGRRLGYFEPVRGVTEGKTIWQMPQWSPNRLASSAFRASVVKVPAVQAYEESTEVDCQQGHVLIRQGTPSANSCMAPAPNSNPRPQPSQTPSASDRMSGLDWVL